MIKKKFLAGCILTALIGCLMMGIVLNVHQVSAKKPTDYSEYNDEYIKKRSAFLALNWCYSSKLKDSISYSNFSSIDFENNEYVVYGKKTNIFKDGTFTGYPNNNSFFSFDKIKCATTDRTKGDSIFRILDDVEKKGVTGIKSSEVTARTEFYEAMGYKAKDASSIAGGKCWNFAYEHSYGAYKYETNYVCFAYDDSGTIVKAYVYGVKSTPGDNNPIRAAFLSASFEGQEQNPANMDRYKSTRKQTLIMSDKNCAVLLFDFFYTSANHEDAVAEQANSGCIYNISQVDGALDGLVNDANGGFKDNGTGIGINDPEYADISVQYEVKKKPGFDDKNYGGSSAATEYVKDSNTTIAAATKYYEDTTDNWRFPWMSTELYYIYLKYAFGAYGAQPILNTCTKEKKDAPEYLPLVMKPDGSDKKEIQYCAINNLNSIRGTKKKVRVEQGMTEKNLTFEEFINSYFVKEANKLDALAIQHIPAQNAVVADADPTIDPVPGEDPSGTEDGGSRTKDPCWDSGIDSMAWIACPTETNLKYFASGIAGYIDDWLEMDSTLYDNDSGAHTAWEYVRTIANTLMIIMLGVIIFSQLTGVGIDNYGIKKILPKFVVMAVLINLSFFICQLAVDLSNIAGNGIQGLFYGVGNNIVDQIADEGKHTTAVSTMQNFIGAIVPSIYAAAAGGSTVISIVATATSGGGAMAVMLVILLLLTILISVLVFFVSIGARIVIVIMCMVLAPLAFACYILPNTKPIFKKWFDAFKIAILIYPICGAMIGISYIIKAIAVTTEMNLAFMVIAGIAPFLPFFMIPTLLKGAFNALGVAGAALGSMGNSLKSNVGKTTDGASNAIRNSENYKNAVDYQNDRRATRRAQRIQNRLGNRENLTDRQRDRLRKANDTLLAHRKRNDENELRTSNGYFEAMQNKQDLEIENEGAAVQRYNDANYVAARRQTLAEEIENQASKDRTTLLNSETRNLGLDQLMTRWETAFRSGDTNNLDALTNVMTNRYGSAAAGRMGASLANMNVAGDVNHQASIQQLQRTMGNNSNFANNMRSKASDAYQMISDAGQAGGTYQNLDYFSSNNTISTDIKDWSTQSAASLQRAIDSGALTEDMMRSILNSDDPSIKSGIQSDTNKRDTLQAAVSGFRNWNDRDAMRRQAEAYRIGEAYSEAVQENNMRDRAARDAAQRQQIADNLRDINEKLHHQNSNGGNNNP